MPNTVSIEWLTSKWMGVKEDVPLGRIKTRGPLEIGQEIKVSYKSGVFKAQILNIKRGSKRSLDVSSDDSDEDVPLNELRRKRAAQSPVSEPSEPATEVPPPSPPAQPATEVPPPSPPAQPATEVPPPSPPAEQAAEVPPPSSPALSQGVVEVPPPSPSRHAPFRVASQATQTESTDECCSSIARQNRDILAILLKEVKMLREQISTSATGRAEKAAPNFVEVDGDVDGNIVIGHPDIAVYVMPKQVYLDVFERVDSPKDFVLKMVSHLFSEADLAQYNYHGGEVLSKGRTVVKLPLKRHPTFVAIAAQADIQWPKASQQDTYVKTLKDAINGKCRKLAQKLGL